MCEKNGLSGLTRHVIRHLNNPWRVCCTLIFAGAQIYASDLIDSRFHLTSRKSDTKPSSRNQTSVICVKLSRHQLTQNNMSLLRTPS
jgi:hypothetical protein